jgi:putative addiction module CopG family antidote
MAQRERLEIDLPTDLAAYVHARAGQGAYANDSDVVSEAVRALKERDAVEDELRRMIAEADADQSPALSDDEVADHFKRRETEWRARGDHA